MPTASTRSACEQIEASWFSLRENKEVASLTGSAGQCARNEVRRALLIANAISGNRYWRRITSIRFATIRLATMILPHRRRVSFGNQAGHEQPKQRQTAGFACPCCDGHTFIVTVRRAICYCYFNTSGVANQCTAALASQHYQILRQLC